MCRTRPLSVLFAMPSPARLRRITGYVTKPGPAALAALTGHTTQKCEAALLEYQDGRSRRGTPSSAIEPAAARLDLGLRLADDVPPWYRLCHVFDDRALQCGIVETGAGANAKPHYAAFEHMAGRRMHFADTLNPKPVFYAERDGNPGRNGDGRKVRNIWVPDDLAQARLRAAYRTHPGRDFASLECWHRGVRDSDLRHVVDQEDWASVARSLEWALDTGAATPVPTLHNPHAAEAMGWLWSAEELGRTGLLVRIFRPGDRRMTAVFAAGLGRDGIEAFRKLKRVARGFPPAQQWPIAEWTDPPQGRWCYGRDIVYGHWSRELKRIVPTNLNPVGSRAQLHPRTAPNSWQWFSSLVAWAWFGLHGLDYTKGQWRPDGDVWVPPRRRPNETANRVG